MKKEEDRELIERYLGGDGLALEALVTRYQQPVYRIAYRMIGEVEEAKDVTQKVFIRAIGGLRSFKRQASFKTWLYRITINICLKQLRQRRRDNQGVVPSLDDPDEVPDRLMRREQQALLREAIDRLPTKQRLTIILRIYEGLSHQEVAETLGCSINAARTHYHLGIKRLKAILKEEEREV